MEYGHLLGTFDSYDTREWQGVVGVVESGKRGRSIIDTKSLLGMYKREWSLSLEKQDIHKSEICRKGKKEKEKRKKS